MSNPPTIVTFKDMIIQQERRVAYVQKVYPIKVLNGEMSAYSARKSITCDERILKLLKKFDKNNQADLFAINSELNRK